MFRHIISVVFLLFVFNISASVAQELALEKTKKIVKDFGDSYWPIREKASDELDKIITFDICKWLISRKTNDSEVQLRIEQGITVYSRRLRLKYSANLKGYPKWPWIDELVSCCYYDIPYKGLHYSGVASGYVDLAVSRGAARDGSPNWENYREATRIWTEERVDFQFGKAFWESKDAKEFNSRISENMDCIDRDIARLVERENKFWKDKGMKNPLLEKK